MPFEKSVSFRTHLQSNIADLIQGVGWNCMRTSQLIAGIVSRLAAYTEEGVPMAPSVFICNSISSLVQRAGMGEFVPLSNVEPLESAGPKLLKAAAPLCRENWRIYVERSENGETCRFGVFCGSSDPSSLSVDEVVLGSVEADFPIVRITQNATNKVEVRTSAGNIIEFRFNDDIDLPALDSHIHLHSLASAIALDIEPQPALFAGFVERILSNAIKNSHGTLIAVVPSAQGGIPQSLKDIVPLTPSIDLYDRFKLHIDESKTAVSMSRLQAAAELVSGLICSDGITVFNTAGKVMGYRAFIRSDEAEMPSDGGARSRAYAAMIKLVGGDLDAAFFKSQDGKTKYQQRTRETPK